MNATGEDQSKSRNVTQVNNYKFSIDENIWLETEPSDFSQGKIMTLSKDSASVILTNIDKSTTLDKVPIDSLYKTTGCLENVCVGSQEACYATNEPFDHPYVPTVVVGINFIAKTVLYEIGKHSYGIESLKTAKAKIEEGCWACEYKGIINKQRVCKKK